MDQFFLYCCKIKIRKAGYVSIIISYNSKEILRKPLLREPILFRIQKIRFN